MFVRPVMPDRIRTAQGTEHVRAVEYAKGGGGQNAADVCCAESVLRDTGPDSTGANN